MADESLRTPDQRRTAVQRTGRAHAEATWLATSLVIALGVVLTAEGLRLVLGFRNPVGIDPVGAGFWAMLGVLPGLVVAGVGNLYAARNCGVLPRSMRLFCAILGGASLATMAFLAAAIA